MIPSIARFELTPSAQVHMRRARIIDPVAIASRMQLLTFRSLPTPQKRRRSPLPLGNGTAADRRTGKTVADFTRAYIRRTLEGRIRGRGQIEIRRSPQWGMTILHRYTSNWSGKTVELAVAQLRGDGLELHLFWKRASGRWAPYAHQSSQPFVGTLDACLKEIQQDRWGCFWG